MMERQRITSRDNQKLKNARRVRDGRASDLMFVEGVRLAAEAMHSGVRVSQAFVASSAVGRGEVLDIISLIAGLGGEVFETSDELFSTLADTVNSQGIVLIAERPGGTGERLTLGPARGGGPLPLFVYLFQANNPANIGAVSRVAEAAGAAGMILSPNSADPFSPKALRGSMGSSFRLPIWPNVAFEELVDWATASGIALTGTAVDGGTNYLESDLRTPRVICFGSEGHGLPGEYNSQMSEKIFVPMAAGVESLNLAVSVGVILFEARRQAAAA